MANATAGALGATEHADAKACLATDTSASSLPSDAAHPNVPAGNKDSMTKQHDNEIVGEAAAGPVLAVQGVSENGHRHDDSEGESDDPMAALLGSLDTHEKALNRKRKSTEPACDQAHDHLDKRAKLSKEPLIMVDESSEEEGETYSSDEGDAASPVTRDWAKDVPAEVWHRVFTWLDPRTLGHLIPVTSCFRDCLDPRYSRNSQPTAASSGGALTPQDSSSRNRRKPTLRFLQPDLIWRTSRRLFWPQMPSPLKKRSELEMWRFCCEAACQFCGEKIEDPPAAADQAGAKIKDDPWHQGPGAKGVSQIFPFFVVSCGECLQERSIREIDLLLSSATPSILVPGLPFVFVTPDWHVIHPQTLQASSVPPTVQVTKVYWKTQAKELRKEFDEVKELGSAAAEEWVKGLEDRGKELIYETARWESWARSGWLKKMQEPIRPATGRAFANQEDAGWHPSQVNNRNQLNTGPTDTDLPQAGVSSSSYGLARTTGGTRRSKEEIEQLRAERRSEIERRASLLHPPISPVVLSEIPSFQAALQIVFPLDNKAWELLKPRLISQRADAEKRVNENTASARARESRPFPGNAHPTVVSMPAEPAREVPDSEWDEAQGPLRARIVKFADEIINDGWEEGDNVKKKTAAQFAAEVLLYIHKRFYAEIAKDAAAATAAGRDPVADPAEGPWTQKLTLENMKWVFDFKIRPFTEKYGKELFVCNGCGGGRYYGLEAVIQHYAAKHTTILSQGSVVVHWRSEWPAEPIFHPDPRNAPAHVIEPMDSSSGNAPHVQHHQPSGYNGYSNSYPPTSYPTFPGPSHPASPYPGPLQAQQPPPLYHQPGPFADPYAHQPPMQTFYNYNLGAASYAPSPQILYPQQQYPPPVMTPNQSLPPPPYPPHLPAPSYYDRPPPQQEVPPAPLPDPRIQQHRPVIEATVATAWKKVGTNLKNVPNPVRAYVTIFHVSSAVHERLAADLSFDIFRAVLDDSKAAAPLRQIRGLTCRLCKHIHTMRNKFSLSELMQHFKSDHEDMSRTRGWCKHMILLPDETVLKGLWRLLKSQKVARSFIIQALPQVADSQGPDGPPLSHPEPEPEPREETLVSGTAAPPETYSAEDSTTRVKAEPSSPEPVTSLTASSRKDPGTERQASHASSEEEPGEYRPLKRAEGVHLAYSQASEARASVREHGVARDELDYGMDIYDEQPRQVIIVDRDGRERIENRPAPRRRIVYEMPQEDYQGRPSVYDDPSRTRGRTALYTEREGSQSHTSCRDEEYDPSAPAIPRRPSVSSPRPEQQRPLYRHRSPRQVRYADDHYHESRPRYRAPPYQEYELVEVRSPSGDYYIRRPVATRRETTEVYYSYDYQPYDRRLGDQMTYEVDYERQGAWPARARTRLPPSLDGPHDGELSHPLPVGPPRRQPSSAEECEDYDPRYPAGHN